MKKIISGILFVVLLIAGDLAVAQVSPPVNYGQSLTWLKRAAESGDAEAQYLLARQMEIGLMVDADIKGAAEWYAKSAIGGYRAAQFRLGEMYYAGKGLSKDYAQAAKWFERAQAQGSMPAAYNLGLIYERGLGVEKNHAKASALYQRAAQVNLAMLFAQGKGVIKDNGRALMWLEVARRSGITVSTFILDSLKAKMSPGEVESAVEMAVNRKAQIGQKTK